MTSFALISGFAFRGLALLIFFGLVTLVLVWCDLLWQPGARAYNHFAPRERRRRKLRKRNFAGCARTGACAVLKRSAQPNAFANSQPVNMNSDARGRRAS